MADADPRAFDGVRVLDLTHVIAGPFATYQLAVLGADIIKIEPPDEPDVMRHDGPRPESNRRLMGTSYLAQAANKRAMTLNLKTPEGRDIFKRLVAGADVVVENYRAGALAALGLGADDLRAIKPAPDLLRHDRLRPDRPDGLGDHLRHRDPGHVRHHELHRHAGLRAAAFRRPDHRLCQRLLRCLRHRLGPVPARADGQGAVHRLLDAGRRDHADGLGRHVLPVRRLAPGRAATTTIWPASAAIPPRTAAP